MIIDVKSKFNEKLCESNLIRIGEAIDKLWDILGYIVHNTDQPYAEQ